MNTTSKEQDLRLLPGRFVVEHSALGPQAMGDDERLALVRGPDGWTIIRRDDEAVDGAWVALWSGDQPHDPQATGMLSAIVAPLAAGEVPVMVASTFHADLVLVPAGQADPAVQMLREAGHRVVR